jgi:hypothetical protein
MGRARWRRPSGPAWGLALAFGLTLALAACSATDGLGGERIPLSGLGAIANAPVGTPTISGNGPGGHYAFVYGNQIWIKSQNDAQPRQLTHLAFSGTSYFAWGPLVWSPDGGYIAFTLVQDLASGPTERGTGPLYIVNTTTGDVQTSAGTASVYGHAYAWYGDMALFYANGSGISFYDLSTFYGPSPADDPRPWRLVQVDNGPDYSSGTPDYVSYGDLAFSGQTLFVTRFDLTSLGATGQIGQAHVWRYDLYPAPGDYSGGSLDHSYPTLTADLGIAYADPHSDPASGAWQIANGSIVYQQVTGVDTKAGTVAAKVCYSSWYYYYCGQQLFQQVAAQPVSARPQVALSGDGSLVALSGTALATQGTDGSGFAKYTPGGWGTPPEWSSDGKAVVATQLVSATPDASGVVHFVTNVIMYTGGKSAVMIAGARDFSWGP